MKKICGIYKITNTIDGKCYIGQSVQVQVRWSQHKHETNKGGGNNPYLYRALRKYGIDKFSFIVLEECGIEHLNELEKKYIDLYDSLYPNGYNLIDQGRDRKKLSPATKLRISKAKLGTISKKRVAINKYSIGGRYIKTFPSMSIAATDIGLLSPSHIADCCTGKRGMAYGFQWRYAKLGSGDISPFIDARNIPVSQYDLSGNFIKTYLSAKDASRATKISASPITACCRGKCKQMGGYVWRYV